MTPLEAIATQLRKWDGRGHLKLRPEPDLWRDGKPVLPEAVSIYTSTGKRCAFDAESIAIFAGAICLDRIPYGDVIRVHWMSKSLEEKVRIKNHTPDFDTLIVERIGGQDVVVEGLGQAVFPLLRAYSSIAASNFKRLESGVQA